MNPTASSHHVLHAYNINPNARFETQSSTERVILLLRAHPFTQIPWVVNTGFLVLLLIVSDFFLPLVLSGPQIVFINVFSIVFILSYAWINFLHWFFNVGLVTNERIVDIDFSQIIYKEVTATKLEKVEDVTSKSAGYFGSLFNYGDVFVQTAGTEVNIEFIEIPRPGDVVGIINELGG